MNMSKYVRLTRTVQDLGILIKPEEIQNHIKDRKIDHYVSTYFYDENHYKEFQKVGKVKGFTGQKTDKVWFDFDSKDDLKLARKDAIELVKRLETYGIKESNLEIFFSGNKGFNVILHLTNELSRPQVESFAQKLAGDLKTFDPSLYDENQILRVSGTKHQSTEYYKTPIDYKELQTIKFNDLFERAKFYRGAFNSTHTMEKIELDSKLFEVQEKETKSQSLTTEVDLSNKPKNWKASKWALLQGFFKAGERDTTCMILTSTCKAMGFDKLTTYYMCKSALKKSWERYGEGDFSKEDLWGKIERIFSEEWKGGQYSEKEDLFLQKKAEELGVKELTNTSTVDIKGALTLFKGYAKNIDHLTLKTGIKELDEKQRITVGMSWGIIAAAGTGKTSVALQILHSMSKAGELCIFFSYDMYAPHVIQKIIQKHWNENENIEVVFDKYKKEDKQYVKKIEDLITKEYPNVEFCFESGQSFDEIQDTIKDVEKKRGQKCRFVAIDYSELVVNDVSDPTQSSNHTAQKARALAATEQICVLNLFQPNKASGDPSSEIKSYLNAKGGQSIGASVSFMLGVSRPGYDPRKPDNDKYMSLNVVKNRMGPIFYIDMYWNGYKGEIRQLTSNEKSELESLRKEIEDEKNGNKDEW